MKREKAERVSSFGVQYEIPVTQRTMPLIRLLRGERNVWAPRATAWRRRVAGEDAVRDLIAALHSQVSDTVGAEVTRDLVQEIGDKMRPLVHRRVRHEIESREARLGHGGKP